MARTDRFANDRAAQALALARAKADPAWWVDRWCWTFDPRVKDAPFLPFDLWPRQRAYLDWLEGLFLAGQDGLCEKARDSGVSWLNVAFAVHKWLFYPGVRIVFGSNKEGKVDKLGDPDSLLEKARLLILHLPRWMRPAGYDPRKHAGHMLIKNIATGATISGEAGDNIGRGGRASMVMIDEAAHLARGALVNAATAGTADCRVLVSSVKGYGNWFAETRFGGTVPVFTFGWQDDPRKSPAWAAAKERQVGSVTWAQEFNMDYGASVEGLIIPKKLCDAAVALWGRLPRPSHGHVVAGVDVGAGKALSVFQPRVGEWVPQAAVRQEGDTTDTAHWVLDQSRLWRAKLVLFDSVGVGAGVQSILSRNPLDGVVLQPVNWGEAAPTRRVWPDGRSSAETFGNLKAEVWWLMRERFRRSYELLLFLQDQEGGHPHDPSDVIVLEPCLELQAQLSTVRWFTSERGKIVVEKKETLAARGVKSPDRADALALSYHEPPLVDFAANVIIGEPTISSQLDF